MEIAVAPFPPWSTRRVAGVSVIAKSSGGVPVTVRESVEVRLPEVPLTVKVDDLIAAPLVAISVSVLVFVVEAGLNAAVTPVGRPVAVRATVPVKPDCGATVMRVLSVPPAATFRLVAEEESLKLGAAVIAKAMVACAKRAPEVAVTVTVDEPTAVDAAAVSFRVAPVKAAVTPAGRPAAVMVGVPVKPFRGVTVMVLDPDAPCTTLKLAGAGATVKLGPAFTVRPIVAEAEVVR
jgi:hypothetical protein